MPVELGRALLVLGQIRRRRGERRLAREPSDALASSAPRRTALGRARDRGAAPDPDPARRPRDLTPTEEQVAALAGAGRTNREVAQALFMSPKTVEANLTRIYGKLGIRSRAELGRACSSVAAHRPGQKIGNLPMRGGSLAV